MFNQFKKLSWNRLNLKLSVISVIISVFILQALILFLYYNKTLELFKDLNRYNAEVIISALTTFTFVPFLEEFVFRYWLDSKKRWVKYTSFFSFLIYSLFAVGIVLNIFFDNKSLTYFFGGLFNLARALAGALYWQLRLPRTLNSFVEPPNFVSLYYFDNHFTSGNFIIFLSATASFGLVISRLIISKIWKIIKLPNPKLNLNINKNYLVLLSSLVFAFVHLINIQSNFIILTLFYNITIPYFIIFTFSILYFFVLGYVLSIIRLRKGMWSAIALHTILNVIASFNFYSSNEFPDVIGFYYLSLIVIGLISIVFLLNSLGRDSENAHASKV